ncbi:MerR family transcriptional regulator [Actinoplanes sp. SE50]|uniref:MerR family transcriptional regulator n=1 Tax=unclassified Actinoplanes TaxID=2626549 RepID=UPI00023EC04D|nr:MULTISPECIES: MerR family transcriptional regulator [unclassified Actinoplanes]AEV82404.1 Multidrug-efflux transporter 1 regulator [Actinoplanes sp. SE50/110]ATO80801.1 MerR family transcriptional regulator [Actinoplanes sp. SE50]SLL98209.1 MerR family transcriptional regulator [Actinoplanes sp. SE50/110]
MLSIGDFAGLGRVSVRMLRHYDAIGLLPPARVDPHSGYRFYTAEQLLRLNRILALKDLGFSLQQVQSMIEEKVDVGELRGMLRLRRAELAAQLERDNARLALVDARLRMVESEGHMDTTDVILKQVPALRVAALSATALGYDHPSSISENLSPLYPRLLQLMEQAGVAMTGSPIAYYRPAPTGPEDETITVHAAFPIGDAEVGAAGFDVVTLPPVRVAAAVHRGPMAEAFRTGGRIAAWIEDNGFRPVPPGYAREVYLHCPPELAEWLTEMQVPLDGTGNATEGN